MKKKIIALCLIVILVATAVVGGTLAWFTSEDDDTNVFTVGSVKIELIESYVHRAGATAYESYVEGYPETPAGEDGNHSDEQIIAGSGDAYTKYLNAQQLMPGISVNKMPYVKNTGKSDAYIRIRVLIPTALNIPTLNSSVVCTTSMDKEFSRPDNVGKFDVEGKTTIGDVEYDIYTFVRNEALKPGEMTYWNVWNTITMDTDVTMEEMEKLIEAGAINADGQFNVLVQADAIQAATFASATEAFAAFDAEVKN